MFGSLLRQLPFIERDSDKRAVISNSLVFPIPEVCFFFLSLVFVDFSRSPASGGHGDETGRVAVSPSRCLSRSIPALSRLPHFANDPSLLGVDGISRPLSLGTFRHRRKRTKEKGGGAVEKVAQATEWELPAELRSFPAKRNTRPSSLCFPHFTSFFPRRRSSFPHSSFSFPLRGVRGCVVRRLRECWYL